MAVDSQPRPTHLRRPPRLPAGCTPIMLPGTLRPTETVWAQTGRTPHGQLAAAVYRPDGTLLLRAVQNPTTRRWSDTERRTRPIRTLPALVETLLWQQQLGR